LNGPNPVEVITQNIAKAKTRKFVRGLALLKIAQIYEDKGKMEKAKKIYKTLSKKYQKVGSVLTGHFDLGDEAQSALRALELD